MSAPAFAWALERGASLSLKPAERLVLLYLADMANGAKVCWPGQPLIVRFTGLAPNTVTVAIKRLAAMQLIRVEASPGKVARYHILRPDTPANGGVVAPANGGVVYEPTPAKCVVAPPQNVGDHPRKCDGQPPHDLRRPPPNRGDDPSYTQEVDPKRRASAPEAGKILSFLEKQEARTPPPEPPTQATTAGSRHSEPEDDNPPVDPGVALAVLDDLKRSLRMRAYPPRAAVMSPDEMATAACGMRHVQPAYLPDDMLAALRADARRSLARRAVVS